MKLEKIDALSHVKSQLPQVQVKLFISAKQSNEVLTSLAAILKMFLSRQNQASCGIHRESTFTDQDHIDDIAKRELIRLTIALN